MNPNILTVAMQGGFNLGWLTVSEVQSIVRMAESMVVEEDIVLERERRVLHSGVQGAGSREGGHSGLFDTSKPVNIDPVPPRRQSLPSPPE